MELDRVFFDEMVEHGLAAFPNEACGLLAGATTPGTTALRYRAEARVRGLVSRLGAPTLTLVGGHFTSGFFGDLERAVRRGAAAVPVPELV